MLTSRAPSASRAAGTLAGVLLFATLHPLPQAPPPTGSITGWLWLMVVLAVIVAGGLVLSSRR
jgi:hypothetical protein